MTELASTHSHAGYVTGRNANMAWIVGSSVAFIVLGIILVATHV